MYKYLYNIVDAIFAIWNPLNICVIQGNQFATTAAQVKLGKGYMITHCPSFICLLLMSYQNVQSLSMTHYAPRSLPFLSMILNLTICPVYYYLVTLYFSNIPLNFLLMFLCWNRYGNTTYTAWTQTCK